MAEEKPPSTPDSVLDIIPAHEHRRPPPVQTTGPEVDRAAPEGGTKAWLSLLGAACAMFVSFGWVNCIALFQAEYETNQLKSYSQSAVSWITSMECTFPVSLHPTTSFNDH